MIRAVFLVSASFRFVHTTYGALIERFAWQIHSICFLPVSCSSVFFPTNATTHWRITHYAPYSHFALCYCAHKFTLLLFYYLYKYNLVWLCAITSSLFFLFLSLCVCGVFFLLLLSLFNKNIYRQMILIVIYTNIDLCVLFSACVVCICMSMWA